MSDIIHGCYDCKYHGRCPYHDSCTGPDTRKSKWELKEEESSDIEMVKCEFEETESTKYLNINVSKEEIERDPDIVRLYAADDRLCKTYCREENKYAALRSKIDDLEKTVTTLKLNNDILQVRWDDLREQLTYASTSPFYKEAFKEAYKSALTKMKGIEERWH